VLLGCVLLGHAPLALPHLRGLWQQEQYQYFPFVLGAVAWLLYSRWQVAPANHSPPRWGPLPWLLLVCSLLLLTVSIVFTAVWLAFVSLIIGLAAFFAWLGRQRQIPYLWGIWLLLWLMVPVPLGMDRMIVFKLQRLSSYLSSSILDSVGIQHLMAGNVLTLSDKQLFMDEACSGIVSVMSIVACSMIYAVWKNRSFLHLVTLTLLGIFWAIILNVVRICIIAAAHDYYDTDLSSGAPHEILGLILFAMMFLALVSTDYLLLTALAPIDLWHAKGRWEKNWLVRIWNRYFAEREKRLDGVTGSDVPDGKLSFAGPSPNMPQALTAGTLFVLLGVVQFVLAPSIWMPVTDTAEARETIERALTIQEEFLPPIIGPWIRESFESIERERRDLLGHYSKVYYYRHNKLADLKVTLSFDFAFSGGWHELCMCYRGGGWRAKERVVQSREQVPTQEDWQYVEGVLKRPDGSQAYLVFAAFDVSGKAVHPPSNLVLLHPWFFLRQRILRDVASQLFQVQVFATGGPVVDESVREEVRQLLLHVRTLFRDRCVGCR
jgi:exosortase